MTLSVYYGENQVALDKELLALKKNYSQVIEFEEMPELGPLRSQMLSIGFFEEPRVYVFRNILLNQVMRGKFSQKAQDVLAFLQQTLPTAQFETVFVETDSNKAKYYKEYFPKAEYHEFSLPMQVFNFVDSFKPKNGATCYRYFKETSAQTAPEMAFYMLKKRVRELLLLSSGSLSGNYQAWQLGKLKKQLGEWSIEKLESVYKSLFKIEESTKTGRTPLTIEQSMEILLSLYL